MYIVAIAWLYVTVLMALTETSFIAGLVTFLLYGALPLGIALYLMGTPARRQARAAREREDGGRDPLNDDRRPPPGPL